MFASGFDQVTEIVCSDFLEENRKYIIRIIEVPNSCDLSEAFTWTKFTKWAYGNADLVNLFRKKCREIKFVDMSKASATGMSEIESSAPYDLINSEWAFCEGSRDLENYKVLIQKCNKMLQKGGSLVLLDLLEQTFWVPDASRLDNRMPTVCVSQDWLKKTLIQNGFAVEHIILHFYEQKHSPMFNAKGNILVWASKTHEV